MFLNMENIFILFYFIESNIPLLEDILKISNESKHLFNNAAY